MWTDFDPEEVFGVCQASDDSRAHDAQQEKLSDGRISETGGEHVCCSRITIRLASIAIIGVPVCDVQCWRDSWRLPGLKWLSPLPQEEGRMLVWIRQRRYAWQPGTSRLDSESSSSC